MSVKITGFDNFEKEMKRLEGAAQELEGERKVQFKELLTPGFMMEYTQFDNLEEFLSASGINSQEDFKAMPEEQMDKIVAATTRFSTWGEMMSGAMKNYVSEKLGF